MLWTAINIWTQLLLSPVGLLLRDSVWFLLLANPLKESSDLRQGFRCSWPCSTRPTRLEALLDETSFRRTDCSSSCSGTS